MAGKKKRDTSAAEKELDRCRQAARMLRGTENVAVIDSFVVDKNNFLSAYKLSKGRETFLLPKMAQELHLQMSWVIK